MGDSADPPDCKLVMDRSLIRSIGRPAIADLLLRIHVSRCTADRDAASFFEELTQVPEEFMRIRSIVLGRKRPRDIFVQPTTKLEDDGAVRLLTYPATREGVLHGFVDRYSLR